MKTWPDDEEANERIREWRRTNDITFNRISVSILGALIAGGVVGIWTMSQNVARLEERVASWTNIFESRMETISAEQRELSKRINSIENTVTRNTNRLDHIEGDHRKIMTQTSPP